MVVTSRVRIEEFLITPSLDPSFQSYGDIWVDHIKDEAHSFLGLFVDLQS